MFPAQGDSAIRSVDRVLLEKVFYAFQRHRISVVSAGKAIADCIPAVLCLL